MPSRCGRSRVCRESSRAGGSPLRSAIRRPLMRVATGHADGYYSNARRNQINAPPVILLDLTFRLQVHLDSDYLCVPKDFLGLAPMSILCARISSVLNPGVEDLDCPLGGGGGGGGAAAVGGTSAGGTADNIRFLFREFVSELLQVRCAVSCFFLV